MSGALYLDLDVRGTKDKDESEANAAELAAGLNVTYVIDPLSREENCRFMGPEADMRRVVWRYVERDEGRPPTQQEQEDFDHFWEVGALFEGVRGDVVARGRVARVRFAPGGADGESALRGLTESLDQLNAKVGRVDVDPSELADALASALYVLKTRAGLDLLAGRDDLTEWLD